MGGGKIRGTQLQTCLAKTFFLKRLCINNIQKIANRVVLCVSRSVSNVVSYILQMAVEGSQEGVHSDMAFGVAETPAE